MKPHPFPRLRPLPRVVRGEHSAPAQAAPPGPADHLPATDPATPERSSHRYKLERRRETRQPARGTIAASYSDGESSFGITSLELVDRSSRGMQVRTSALIRPGMRVDLRGTEHAAAIVVRTRTDGHEMLVGLSLIGGRKAA